MSRAALTLEVLAKEWARGEIETESLVICGHPHGRRPVPGTAHATEIDRWFYCLYAKRPDGWHVVREAQNSALRARTWWKLDSCLRALNDRRVFPTTLKVLPRGPAPTEFPPLPRETEPTESASRVVKPPKPSKAPKAAKPGKRAASWLDDDAPPTPSEPGDNSSSAQKLTGDEDSVW